MEVTRQHKIEKRGSAMALVEGFEGKWRRLSKSQSLAKRAPPFRLTLMCCLWRQHMVYFSCCVCPLSNMDGGFCKWSAVQQQTTYQIREKSRGKQINRRYNTATISPIFVDQLMTQLKYIFHKKGKFLKAMYFFQAIYFIISFIHHHFLCTVPRQIMFWKILTTNWDCERPPHSPLGAEKAICEWKACAQGAFTRSSTTLIQRKLS